MIFYSRGACFTYAQDGKLTGKVFDEKTQVVLPLAVVQVSQDSVLKGGTVANINGVYQIPTLLPGEYTVTVTYVGYEENKVEHVTVNALKTTFLDFPMKRTREGSQEKKVKKKK